MFKHKNLKDVDTTSYKEAVSDTQQLMAIFETAVDCIIIINDRGIISKINPAGARLFGYHISELTGENINILIPTPYRENYDDRSKNYENSSQAKIVGIGQDITAIRKDGSTFLCKLSMSEFYIGQEKCYAGIIHDLTARKKAEDKIIELNRTLEEKVKAKTQDLSAVVSKLLISNQKLEKEIQERGKIEKALRDSELEIRKTLEKERELNDLKSRFVSMASHEFRTPLSTILSSTTLIQKYCEKGMPEKAHKHFGRIQSTVSNLTEILDDFLSLSKLEEGKIQRHPEKFDLAEFCHEFLEEVEGLLKPGQTIEKQLREHVEVFLDKKLLRNILLNLFSNATKYSAEGKEITCVTDVCDCSVIIQIRDQGIGIPEGEQKHLWSRFFRGSNVINIKGTGLGLNIVKQYVDMMEGEIQFESEENNGTTVTVRIPN
ncbi:MAG: PAS domain-containing sensor histidine kinase [Bacteroidota bacterium]